MNNRKKIRWWWILLMSIIARVGFILLTFPYMYIYAHFINTGHNAQFYKDYFFDNRAWISTGLGIPVFFLIGIWIAKKTNPFITVHILWFWIFYTLGDIPIELLGGDLENFWQQLIVAHITKLFSLYLGARIIQSKRSI